MNAAPRTAVLAALGVLSGAAGCDQRATGAVALAAAPRPDMLEHSDEKTPHAELPSCVRLPPEVIAAAGIETAPVRPQWLPDTIELSGEIAADPDSSARVTARLPGRIVQVRFKEGERVQAGAVLVVLESAELARTRAALLAAQARALSLQKNVERLERLTRSNLAAGQEVLNAAAELRAVQAEATAAQRTLLSLGLSPDQLADGGTRLELRAPRRGSVVARDAVVGQMVTAEHTIAEIVDLDRVYFLGRLFEKDLARVHPGEAAEVRLNAYPGEVFTGTVEAIGKQMTVAARTVVARIAIHDRDELLKIGLFGTARVSSGAPAAPSLTLVVPLSAVTHVADRDVVFVCEPDDDFQVHPVTLGRSAAGQIEVLSGLRAGEQVVVQGAFTLKSVVLHSTLADDD